MYLLYRTPILNKSGQVFGYEVFTIPKGACLLCMHSYGNKLNALINFLVEENIFEFFGSKKLVIPIKDEELNVELLNLLVPKRTVLKIILRNELSQKLLRDVSILRRLGFEIMIDSFNFENSNYISLVKDINYISVSAKNLNEFLEIKNYAKSLGKKILLTDIETEEEFKRGVKVAHLLQGSYISPPCLFRHYKNYKFLYNFFVNLVKNIRKKTRGELYTLVKADKKLRKLVEIWSKKFFPDQRLDSLELRIIVFIYLIKDLFVHPEGKMFVKTGLFRAFLMREFANLLAPERSREAFITGLLSSCDDFLEIPSLELARSLEYSDDILQALESMKGDLGYILSNVYLVETCVVKEEGCEERTYRKLGLLFNRNTEEIREAVERAKGKTETLITLLHRSEVPESIDLQQRNKLAQL